VKKLLWLLVLLPSLALAQVPISLLPSATTSTTGVEVFPVVQAGVTQKMSLSQIQAFLEGASNLWTGGNTFNVAAVFNGGYTEFGGATPVLFMYDSSAPAFSKVWGIQDYSSEIHIRPCNDALTACYNDAFMAAKSGTAVQSVTIGNSADNPTINLAGGTVAGSAAGGNQGTGTVNAVGLFINGIPVGTTAVKIAYASFNGIGACNIDTQVASANLAALPNCTYSGTGSYVVKFAASYFTAPPACTVTPGSGSSGGSNAASVQSVTTALSGSTYIASVLMFNLSVSPQDNHFMITCMGQ
jgi:hypothetical protein